MAKAKIVCFMHHRVPGVSKVLMGEGDTIPEAATAAMQELMKDAVIKDREFVVGISNVVAWEFRKSYPIPKLHDPEPMTDEQWELFKKRLTGASNGL